MGGRGASSGFSRNKDGSPRNRYGTQYRSLLTVGNVKFVRRNQGATEALMETMTRGRVYGLVGRRDELSGIVYFDDSGKRAKQIDLNHAHRGVRPHVHHGYEHNELDGRKGATGLTAGEREMVARLTRIWENRRR